MNEEEKKDKTTENPKPDQAASESDDTVKESDQKTEGQDNGNKAPEPDENAGAVDSSEKNEEPEWAAEFDTYPLREKSEDPKWAIRTVWTWLGFDLFCIAGILLLLILGAIYD